MKKALILALLSITMFLTGCSASNTQTNVCKMTQTESGIEGTTTIQLVSSEDQVKVINIEMVMDLTPYGEAMAALALTSVQDQFKQYEDMDGVTITSNSKDAIITIQLTMDATKISNNAEISDISGLGELDTKLSKCIEELEEQGFTCN